MDRMGACGASDLGSNPSRGIEESKVLKMEKKKKITWGLILAIISIILTIILAFVGPKLYYLVFGKLIIDYKEDDFSTKEGINYSKIEILNNLEYPLEYVNGTATLNCIGFNSQYRSGTFKLEEGRDFLANGQKSEYLFAPDSLLINLAENTKNFTCVDAVLEIAEYIKLNETHSKLNQIDTYEFFEEKGLLKVVKRNKTSQSPYRKCLRCKIIIDIYALGKKHFSKTEYYTFVGGQTSNFFSEIIETPLEPAYPHGNLYRGQAGFAQSFHSCDNLSSSKECTYLLYQTINQTYKTFSLDWKTFSSLPILFDNPIINRNINW